MCRRKCLLGYLAIAFGAGLLLAAIFPLGFLLFLFAFVLIAVGALLIRN